MGLLNIKHGQSVIQLFFVYDQESSVFRFKEDIKLGDWTISKNIANNWNRNSSYKYDIKDSLQFVITDKNGESRITDFYFNNDNTFPHIEENSPDDTVKRGIRRYLEFHPIFSSKDWQDYDSQNIIEKIRAIIDNKQVNPMKKLENIRKLIG